MTDSLLTPEEAATRLRTTVGTLATWRSTGRHPSLSKTVEQGGAVIKRGRQVFYLASAVDAFGRQSQAV